MCDDDSKPLIDPNDPIVGALSRALTQSGPGGDVVGVAKSFPSLHESGEIVGIETFDSAHDLQATGVRFVDTTERDLAYRFGTDEEIALRLSPGALMARLPGDWVVAEVFVQTLAERRPASVDDDNYVLFFGPLDSPLRLVVICEGTIRCTPWTIA